MENAAEHPISYGATLETTLGLDEEAWRMRARRGDQDDAASFVAIDTGSGRWVGMMACQLGDEDGSEPVLTGVYVTATFRGRGLGVADALLDRVEEWAAAQSPLIRLWVYEKSDQAQRFYLRREFHFTGKDRPMDLLHGERLLEMERALRRQSGA
jgi:GNAT superfamily N-acetyltransferase